MIVIVPHRDLELKLITAQKKIIKEIYDCNIEMIPYAVMPLWIQTDFESVDDAKKEITHVSILAPEYDDEQKGLVCPVKIEKKNGNIFESELNFISGLPRHCEERSDVAIQAYDDTFPLPVKIFRLGECTSPKPGVYELSSPVWKKTK